jgi:hypothetical protein
MLMLIPIVALVLALGGGGWGHSRYGYVSWSPAGLILVILLIRSSQAHCVVSTRIESAL